MRKFQSRVVLTIVCLGIAFSAGFADSCSHAAGPKGKKAPKKVSLAKPTPRLTVQERRFLQATERKLVTKFNSKDNPGDRDTWYALLFKDEVVAQTLGASSSSSHRSVTLATMHAIKPDGAVVQGKKEAALAIARFMYGINNAAKGLRPPSTGESGNTSRAAGNKAWTGEAFKTKKEAEAWLDRMLPPKLSAKKK